MRWRRPLLRPEVGRVVVGSLCGWELAALWSGLPTVSSIVRRSPALGVVLLVALAHHWLIEQEAP